MHKDRYAHFYALGLVNVDEDDVEAAWYGAHRKQAAHRSDLLDKALAGETVRDVAYKAAKVAIDHQMTATLKLEWMKENAEAIAGSGGDGQKAYSLYVQGRVDRVANHVEQQLAEEFVEEVGEDDGEEDNPYEDDEDDEDEDEDENEEEDDDDDEE